MRFSPGCSCCGAEDCAGCLPLMPASVFAEVIAVTGDCTVDFSVGESWELPLAVTESNRKVYRVALIGKCGNYLEVFLDCGVVPGSPPNAVYSALVAVSGNAYPTIPSDTTLSGNNPTTFDCADPVDVDVLTRTTGLDDCCPIVTGSGTVTFAVTE